VTLSWSLRLLCLLLIAFGLLNAALQAGLARCAPFILRRLHAAPARRRERILYRIQLAPALTALFLAATVCTPAYLRFEPIHGGESVSGLCLLLAAATSLWIAYSLLGGLRIAFRTLRFTRACRLSGRLVQRCGPTPVVAVVRPACPVALLGFRSPLIIISTDLLADDRLSPEALAVALDHERSHVLHRDNWKLLSLTFLPRLTILFGDPWEPAWRAAADWAADDDAVRGDSHRSLLLADAIVRTARAARATPVLANPAAPLIHTALTSAEASLAARIDRLLHPHPAPTRRSFVLPGMSAVILLVTLAAFAASSWIYSFSESLLHLGRF
jgi:Zn-dependent protease with chaperone function